MSQTEENIDNSSALANDLFTSLTTGVSIPVVPDFSDEKFSYNPDQSSPLFSDISSLSIEDVTAVDLNGTGSFDKFMSAMDLHLQREFKGNRITGAQYAEAYVNIANHVMGQAVSFALQKDQAKWNAITAQMQARIMEAQATEALVSLEKSKLESTKAHFDMNLTAAEYAQTKMKIATEEANHNSVTMDVVSKTFMVDHQMPANLAVTQYEHSAVMPSTVAMNEFQVNRILPAQASISEFQNQVLQPLERDIQILQRDRIIPTQADLEDFKRDNLQPVELAQQQHLLKFRQPSETELIREQIETQRANTLDTRTDGMTPISGVVGLQKQNLTTDVETKEYVLENQLPRQVELVNEQITMTTEQSESERAKTLDVRSDGQVVKGSVGKQKDLYEQQIDSFIKDAQHKTAKMYLDSWITQKTLDEGLNAPTQFTNTEVNEVLSAVRTNNNLGS